VELLLERPGLAVLRLSGAEAGAAFQHEGGGHRWQRVQASTLTVTVMAEPGAAQLALRKQDLLWQTTPEAGLARATGAIVNHRPTGLTVCCDGGQSLQENRELALALLRARLFAAGRRQPASVRAFRRTVSLPTGEVCDHVLGQRWPLAEYLLGAW
jgi:protein subunit release factor A